MFAAADAFAFLASFFSRFVGTGGRVIGIAASESDSDSNPSRRSAWN